MAHFFERNLAFNRTEQSQFEHVLVSLAGFRFEIQNLVLRRIYPFLLGVVVLIGFCLFQARQFKRLYEHIKNDKYGTSTTSVLFPTGVSHLNKRNSRPFRSVSPRRPARTSLTCRRMLQHLSLFLRQVSCRADVGELREKIDDTGGVVVDAVLRDRHR